MCSTSLQLLPRVCPSYRLQSDFSGLVLTVVQGDQKYSLDHVIDIELLAKLLPGPEGAADLCN